MVGNREKMTTATLISSTTNEWPQLVQNQIDEQQKKLMSSTNRAMETPETNNQDHHHQQQQQQQQQQQLLNCPRCDSTNTKFCYYNNYSLSQPRHFCKACKRYWTRGGTLRNVPVGGGCRKNKRVKRPNSSSTAAGGGDAAISSAPTVTTTNPTGPLQSNQLDLPSNSNNHINPLFYSLPSNNHIELNLPYSSSFSNTVSGFHLQPQINALGLGFSSGLFLNNNNGFNSSKQLIQDVITPSSSILSSNPIFGSSTFASTFQPQQQKFMNSAGLKDHTTQGLISQYEDHHLQGNGGNSAVMKEVKMEGNQNPNWNISNHNHIEQINSSDPSFLWNTSSVGAWLDPSNMGSSVSSLM